MIDIAKKLADVNVRIRQAETRYGRDPGSVQLLAVSKTKPVEAILAAVAAGHRSFGENYVQEAQTKIEALATRGLDWHFIGPIQSNKTRMIATLFSWVHSVDREKIAHRLSEQRPADLPPLNICLQVNVSHEDTKSGVALSELPELVQSVRSLTRIRLRGLMAIPAPCEDFEKQRAEFRQLADALKQLNREFGLQMDTLSMGMSDDLEAAVAEGATWVRVGTGVFGARG